MNFLWLYQIPTVWLGILIVGLFVGASAAGLLSTRPLARRLCREQNDFVNFFFATIAVFYAVLVGLIAIVCLLAIAFFGSSTSTRFSKVGSAVGGAGG